MSHTTLGVKNFSLQCFLGALPEKRKIPQSLLLDLEVLLEHKGLSSDLRKSLSHEDLLFLCQKTASEGEFFLLESYVEKILDLLFSDDRILHAKICVKKQLSKEADYYFVQKERKR